MVKRRKKEEKFKFYKKVRAGLQALNF